MANHDILPKIWNQLLLKDRSFLRSFFGSFLIATAGFLIIAVVYRITGLYIATFTVVSAIVIAFYGGLFPGLFWVILLHLAADYFFIPPVGDVFENADSFIHFSILCVVVVGIVFFGSSLRSQFFQKEIAKQEAENAAEARDLLIAVISHELKNPLNAIGMNMQLLKKTTILEQIPTLNTIVENTNTSVRRMARLVSDLLDAANFDAGRVKLEITKVKVSKLVTDVIATFTQTAKAKLIQLDYQISEQCPAEIVCDQDRIYQALSNLVGNAIKFTKQGSVTIQVNSSETEIQFQVKDTGPGIPKEYFQKVFDRFWQAKETAYQGTGLGLNITKGIAEAHGGKLWLESTEGKGSSFYLTFPLVQKATQELSKKIA